MPSGAMTGGSAPMKSSSLLTRHRVIKELHEENENKQKLRENIKRELNKKLKELESIDIELGSSKNQLGLIEIELTKNKNMVWHLGENVKKISAKAEMLSHEAS